MLLLFLFLTCVYEKKACRDLRQAFWYIFLMFLPMRRSDSRLYLNLELRHHHAVDRKLIILSRFVLFRLQIYTNYFNLQIISHKKAHFLSALILSTHIST